MPLYEYRCESCDERFEELVSSSDEDDVRCPSCGQPAKKLLSAFSVGGGGSGGFGYDQGGGSSCGFGGG